MKSVLEAKGLSANYYTITKLSREVVTNAIVCFHFALCVNVYICVCSFVYGYDMVHQIQNEERVANGPVHDWENDCWKQILFYTSMVLCEINN